MATPQKAERPPNSSSRTFALTREPWLRAGFKLYPRAPPGFFARANRPTTRRSLWEARAKEQPSAKSFYGGSGPTSARTRKHSSHDILGTVSVKRQRPLI